MSKIRLMIADGYQVVREGLVAMLRSCEDINIICTCDGSCGDVEIANQTVLKKNPDVILLEIKVGEIDGIDVARRLAAQRPEIKVIFLTVFEDSKFMSLAWQAGANGYILKHVSSEVLIDDIKRVYMGEKIFAPSVINIMVDDYVRLFQMTPPRDETEEKIIQFTPREREIFFYLTQGMTNKELSLATNLSVDTIKTHLQNIFRKLEVRNRSQAVNKGLKYKNLSQLGFGLKDLQNVQ